MEDDDDDDETQGLIVVLCFTYVRFSSLQKLK